MTLQELYSRMGGDYDQAISVLRVDKLVDKHIRKFARNGVVEELLEAGKTLEPGRMFEAAHAAKGVCGNLGLREMAEVSSDIAEEFRPGHPRRMTDDEVRERLNRVETLLRGTLEGISQYEAG